MQTQRTRSTRADKLRDMKFPALAALWAQIDQGQENIARMSEEIEKRLGRLD